IWKIWFKFAFGPLCGLLEFQEVMDLIVIWDITRGKPPIKNDWDLLFQPMFDEYFKSPSAVSTPISAATLLPSDIAGAVFFYFH
ncbi:hypothetical protein Tco_0306747, partial [Tanacetum coccineum]